MGDSVGDSESILCTIANATRVEWLKDGSTVVESGTGSQLTLMLSINDSIHHSLYTCRGYSTLRPITDLNITTIVNGMLLICASNIFIYNIYICTTIVPTNIYLVSFLRAVPNTAIVISIIEVSAPTLGQIVRIRCVISEGVSGLSTRPVPQWFNNDGSNVVIGDGVSLDGPSSGSSLTTLTLIFNTLHTSHAGRYICRGSLSSPALFSPLVKTEDYNISLQSEVTLNTNSVYFLSPVTDKIYSVHTGCKSTTHHGIPNGPPNNHFLHHPI